jgi:microtubule-associated protein-like 1/2
MGDQCINKKNNSNSELWRNNIIMPDQYEKLEESSLLKKPRLNAKLEYVFGYRTRDTRNNLRYINEKEIVYHCGFYGIIHDIEKNTQKIFSEHTDDISCLVVNPQKTLIATGQINYKSNININNNNNNNEKSFICIWDTDANLITKFEGNFFKGIISLDFSPDSNLILAVSASEEHDIFLFDIKENRMVGSAKGGSFKVLDCCFKTNKEFATVGIKHFKYWMIKNGNLYPKEGFFGQCDNKLGLVVCNNGNFITGSAFGELTIWREEVILTNKKPHLKNVDSLYSQDD